VYSQITFLYHTYLYTSITTMFSLEIAISTNHQIKKQADLIYTSKRR